MDEDAESQERASLVRVLRHTAIFASKLGERADATKLFDEATRASADDPSEAVQLELAFTCAAEESVRAERS
jgi:hypothetical protein